jgi:nucleoside-diphosphate-sugar epimerase
MKPLLRKKGGIQKKPHSDYAISKYGAEMEIWRGQQEGLDVIIVNPGIMWSRFPRTGKRPTFKEVLTDYGITPGKRSIRRS